ncbi:MAG: antibiotic biosynthesis monooxygenase [Chloroflexia bacterium]|nr:antibiotic biosynthesis monooxygenase [Chloroflexia bacterium]
MESAQFDGLVRSFGQCQSRRQTLRGLAGVVAGTSALALSVSARAQDATPAGSPAAEASTMGREIAWMPEWKVKSGTYEDVRALLDEMEASAENEAGTLSYALYVSEDGQTITFYERYADEAAVLAHQATFSERFAERANDAMVCSRITVFGAPGEEVRQSISGCNPVYLTPLSGFTVR